MWMAAPSKKQSKGGKKMHSNTNLDKNREVSD